MEKTILLVDDHPIITKGLRLLLADEEDLRVVGEADDGQRALDLVREFSPDLVVMDITMPGMNGVEATQQIIREFPKTKIMALSIHREKHFVEEMLVAGAVGYILKESVPEELVKGIKTLIRGEMYLSPSITDVVVSGYKHILKEVEEKSEAADRISRTILSTKVHHPPVAPDLLPRPALFERLDQGLQRTLSLISAPAGYGKTTLISAWLETCENPSAWLTLDDEDNDPVLFLNYFIASIQCKFPVVGQKILIMLQDPDLPSLSVLIRNLTHDLDQLDEDFILVLDDYHRIHETAVHDLLSELLRHPPRRLHLVIASRGNPPLNITRLRARRQIIEIHTQELRFTLGEAGAFLHKVMGIDMDQAEVAKLNEKTEGWVTALRLDGLSLRHREGVEKSLGSRLGISQYTRDYLTIEVFYRQPRNIQEYMMKTALLERFCAPLCEEVCRGDNGSAEAMSGRDFLKWLEDKELFVIPLDEQHEWFRFHHLFKEVLLDLLVQQCRPDEIVSLRTRASHWFAENGLITEALRYALAADDTVWAAQIAEKNIQEILNDDKWYILGKWLSMLPDTIIQQSPDLLMAQAWLYYFQFKIMDIVPLLDRAEKFLDIKLKQRLAGEIDFFKGCICYFQSQGRQSEEYFSTAIEKLPETFLLSRGEAELNYSLALHMNGRKDTAVQGIHNGLQTIRKFEGIRSSRLVAGLALINLLEGELTEVLYTVKQDREIVSKHQPQYAESWSLYCEALVHYYQNNLEKAAELFNQLVQMRYLMHSRAALDSLCGLAFTYQALQNADGVQETIKLMHAFTDEMNDASYTTIALSCQTHLSILQGDVVSDQRWLPGADLPDIGLMLWWLEIPRLTECRKLIAEGSDASLQMALSKLKTFRRDNEVVHNRIQQISVHSLMALSYMEQGSTDDALAALESAIELATPGRFIRPFVESGTKIADLLNQLYSQGLAQDFIAQILSAISGGTRVTTPSAVPVLGDPLTERELQTLRLLAGDLSTEEIAAEMVVTQATVRTHSKHIYGKLKVHSRHEAVQRGKDLGML